MAADSDLTRSVSVLAERPLVTIRCELHAAAERARRDMEAAQKNLALAYQNLRNAESALEEAQRQKAAGIALRADLVIEGKPSGGQTGDT